MIEKYRKLIFVPNFGVKVTQGGGLIMPKQDGHLVEGLAQEVAVTIVAKKDRNEDMFYDGGLQRKDIRRLIFNEMGASNKFNKLVNYVKILIKVFAFYVNKKNTQQSITYIYFPGYMAIVALAVCLALGKPFALYVRGDWRFSKFYRMIEKKVFEKSEWILTTGLTFSRIIAQFNSNVHPVSPMMAFRGANGGASVSHSINRWLFVGHIVESKGVFDVLRALKTARDKGYEQFLLTIVGGGEPQNVAKLQGLVAELNLRKNVRYVGHLSDKDCLRNEFQNSDVFVYPSYYYEGFPRVVYEAMTFGLPICCTILAGMKGFMKSEINCIEVYDRNPGSILEGVERLVDDPELAQSIGRQAQLDIGDYLRRFEDKDHLAQVFERVVGVGDSKIAYT